MSHHRSQSPSPPAERPIGPNGIPSKDMKEKDGINLAQLLPNRTIFMVGYLHKQSGGAFKSWQKRYCVLHDEPAMLIYPLNPKKGVKKEGINNAAKGDYLRCSLSYYKPVQHGNTKDEQGKVEIQSATIQAFPAAAYGRDYCFGVRAVNSDRMYIFHASSESERQSWMDQLKACQCMPAPVPSSSSSASASASASDASYSDYSDLPPPPSTSPPSYSPISSSPPSSSPPVSPRRPGQVEEKYCKWQVVWEGTLRVRAQPTTIAEKIASLPSGAVILELERQGDWVRHELGWSMTRSDDGIFMVVVPESTPVTPTSTLTAMNLPGAQIVPLTPIQPLATHSMASSLAGSTSSQTLSSGSAGVNIYVAAAAAAAANAIPAGQSISTGSAQQSALMAINRAKQAAYATATGSSTVSSTASAVPNAPKPGPLKTGYLRKTGDSVVTHWKRRWFVLSTRRLEYFKTEKEERPLGYISLAGASVTLHDDGITFSIQPVKGKRKYNIKSDVPSERQEWVNAIAECTRVSRRALEKAFDSGIYQDWSKVDITQNLLPSLSRLIAKLPPSGILRSGYLVKMGERVKNFKRRFFVLVGSLLLYFESEADAFSHKAEKEEARGALGVIPLSNCVIALEPLSAVQKPFGFSIDTPSRKYFLFGDNDDDVRAWTYSIHLVLFTLPIQQYMQEKPANANEPTRKDMIDRRISATTMVSADESLALQKQLLVVLRDPTLCRFFQSYWYDRQSQRPKPMNHTNHASTSTMTSPSASPTTSYASLTISTTSSTSTTSTSPSTSTSNPDEDRKLPLSQSYLSFWLDAEDFALLPAGTVYQFVRAEQIIDTYFSHGAPQPVFIDYSTLQDLIAQSVAHPIPVTLFKKAQETVLEAIVMDVFARYLASKSVWSYTAAVGARYDDLMMMQRIQSALARSAQGDNHVSTSSVGAGPTATAASSADVNNVSSIARHAAVDLESVGVQAGQIFAMLPPNDTSKQLYTNMLYFLLQVREYVKLYRDDAVLSRDDPSLSPSPPNDDDTLSFDDPPKSTVSQRVRRKAADIYHRFIAIGATAAILTTPEQAKYIRQRLSNPTTSMFSNVELCMLGELVEAISSAQARLHKLKIPTNVRDVGGMKPTLNTILSDLRRDYDQKDRLILESHWMLRSRTESQYFPPTSNLPMTPTSTTSTLVAKDGVGAGTDPVGTPTSTSTGSLPSDPNVTTQSMSPTDVDSLLSDTANRASNSDEIPFRQVLGVPQLCCYFRRFMSASFLSASSTSALTGSSPAPSSPISQHRKSPIASKRSNDDDDPDHEIASLRPHMALFVAIQGYRKLSEPTLMVNYARRVYAHYFGEHAPSKIAYLSNRTIDEFRYMVKSPSPGPHIFDSMHRELYKLLQKLYPAFQNSGAMYAMMADEHAIFQQIETTFKSSGAVRAQSWYDPLDPAFTDDSPSNLSSQHAIWCKFFVQFLQERFCAENAYFFFEADDFRRCPGHHYRLLRAQRLFDKFIASDAALQVNLQSRIQQDLTTRIKSAATHIEDISTLMFMDAQREIFHLMCSDSVPPFLLSPYFKNYLAITQPPK